MNRLEESAFDPDGGPIPLDQLKAIIGGNRPLEQKPMDGDRAVALTAGGEATAHAPVSGEAIGFADSAPKVTSSTIKLEAAGKFDARFTYGPSSSGPSGAAAGAVDVHLVGTKGDTNSLVVTVQDHGAKTGSLTLTAAELTERASSGDSLFKDIASRVDTINGKDKTSGDLGKDIDKSFRGDVKTKTAGPSGGHSSWDAEAKGTLVKMDEKGKIHGPEGEASSHAWMPKAQAKLEKEANAEGAKARAGIETAQVVHEQAVNQQKVASGTAASLDAARDKVKTTTAAAQDAVKSFADASRTQQVSAHKGASETAEADKAQADKTHKAAVAKAEKTHADAQAALTQAVAAKPSKAGGGPDGAAPKKDGANQKGTTAERENLAKAIVANGVAKAGVTKTGKDLDAASQHADTAARKFADAKKAVAGHENAVSQTMADASAAKKALDKLESGDKPRDRSGSLAAPKTDAKQSEDTRARANTVAEKPSAAQDSKATLTKTAMTDKILSEKKAALKAAEEKLLSAPTEKAQKEKLQKDDVKALKNIAKDKGLDKAKDLLRDVILDQARQDAIAQGKYHAKDTGHVLAGGTEQTVSVEGNTTVKDTTVAQVKTETKTVDFETDMASQHTREAAIRLQGGLERVNTTDLGDGGSRTEVAKIYGELGGEARAEIIKTKDKVSVEAGAKLVAHVEAKYSETIKTGIIETTQTASVTGHAEAGVKAGATLGFDGAEVKLSASAEASVKANLAHDVKIGDVTLKSDLEVFAKAKAEAKADVKVNFNPFGKEGLGAKASVGLEAAAGVGVEKKLGMKSAGGGGAEVGGGLYAGKIGAKADVDLGYKDGKLTAGVNFGAALGVGISVNIKVESNIKLAMENAKKDIERGNVLEKFRGVLTNNPIGGFVRGLFS